LAIRADLFVAPGLNDVNLQRRELFNDANADLADDAETAGLNYN
jgi:hypothetical protein